MTKNECEKCCVFVAMADVLKTLKRLNHCIFSHLFKWICMLRPLHICTRWMTQRCTFFLDAMTRCDGVFTLHAIKPFFPHYQICMCQVKLETCPVRAIIAAIVASRAATRQCEQIIKKKFVSRIVAPLDASLSVRKDHNRLDKTMQLS